MSIEKIVKIITNYYKMPCNGCLIMEVEEKPDVFEIIYHTEIIGHVGYVPIVGDSIFGYTVWEVDYKHRYAYVDD